MKKLKAFLLVFIYSISVYSQDALSINLNVKGTNDGKFITIKDYKVCYSYDVENAKIGYGLCSPDIDFSIYRNDPKLKIFETRKEARKEKKKNDDPVVNEPKEPTKPVEPEKPQPPIVDNVERVLLLPEWKPTAVRNWINLDQFPDIKSSDKLIFDWGYGSPVFQEMVKSDELVQPLKKGWNHIWNASLLTERQAPKTSNFTSEASLNQTADLLVHQGVADAHFATKNEFPTGFQWISSATAYAIGQRYYGYRTNLYDATATADKVWSRQSKLILFDHETYWEGDLVRKLGDFAKGLNDASNGDVKLLIYGSDYTATNFLVGDPAYYAKNQSSETIQKAINGYYKWGYEAFDGTNTYADFMWKYLQTTLPVKETIWQKNPDGSYKKDAQGRRIFREDEFVETINGETVTFLRTTEPLQREWAGRDENGNLRWSPDLTRPDVDFGIREQYKQYDKFLVWQAARMKYLTGKPDISRWSDGGVKPMMVLRTEKEGGAALSNHRDTEPDLPHSPAEGISQILIPMFSGSHGITLWNNSNSALPYGHPSSPIQNYSKNGTKQHPNGMNYAAYEASTAAVNAVTKAYEGIEFNETLRYLFFTKPIDGLNNRHMIACGFYQGNILNLAFYYPFQDYTDYTDVVISFSGKQIKERVTGKMPIAIRYNVDVKDLKPEDFNITYKNIDGMIVNEQGSIIFD